MPAAVKTAKPDKEATVLLDTPSRSAEQGQSPQAAPAGVDGAARAIGAAGVRSPAHLLAMQRSAGNRAVVQLLHQSKAPAPPRAAMVVQRDWTTAKPTTETRGKAVIGTDRNAPLSETSKWRHAGAHFNLPWDSGHTVSWGLHEKLIMENVVKNRADRKDIMDRAKVLEHNMYGPGKWGKAMGTIDTCSRISHLIGMIAGIVSLVCGIVGLVHPAALPVGAIAGIVAMSAHGVMAVLQSILVGHNAIRIQKLPPEERAKVWPTLMRDITKLVFAVVGVGLGAGGAAVAGMHGILATSALQGADKVAHIGMMVGENVGEGMAGSALFGGISYADYQESELGRKGAFDKELAEMRNGGHSGGGGGGGLSPELISAIDDDSSETESTTKVAKNDAQEAGEGVKGQDSEVRSLDELTTSKDKLDSSFNDLESSTKDDKSTEQRLESQPNKVNETNKKLKTASKELGKVDGESDPELDGPEPTEEQKGKGRKELTVSRAGGFFGRAGAWIKSKVLRLVGRTKKVVAKIKTKLVALTMKIMGLRKHQLALEDGLVEKGGEAKRTTSALTEAETLAGQYKAAVTQAKQLQGAGKK